jgi:hypothetical protein
MQSSPLASQRWFKGGGVQTASCNKHAADNFGKDVLKVLGHVITTVPSMVSLFNNPWVFPAFRRNLAEIFKGNLSRESAPDRTRNLVTLHRSVHDLLDSLNQLQASIDAVGSRGLTKIEEGNITRWGWLARVAAKLFMTRKPLLVALIVALGQGTDEAKLELVRSLFSAGGLRDENRVQFAP